MQQDLKSIYQLISVQQYKTFSFSCGQNCLNRIANIECTNQNCSCTNYCRNRRFQRQEYMETYPIRTQNKGWGLSAGQYISKGSFVMQYVGEVYDLNSDIGEIRREKYKHTNVTYLMKMAESQVVDPTRVGNLARLINHSCDPNCKTQKWNVNGDICIGIFAIKDIQEEQELSFNYNMDCQQTAYTECYCGSLNCVGFLGKRAYAYVSEDQEEKSVQEDHQADQMDKRQQTIESQFGNQDACCVCKKSTNQKRIVRCWVCYKSFHLYCLDRILKNVPKLKWRCPKCRKSNNKSTNGQQRDESNLKVCEQRSQLFIQNVKNIIDEQREELKKEIFTKQKYLDQSHLTQEGKSLYTESYNQNFSLMQRLFNRCKKDSIKKRKNTPNTFNNQKRKSKLQNLSLPAKQNIYQLERDLISPTFRNKNSFQLCRSKSDHYNGDSHNIQKSYMQQRIQAIPQQGQTDQQEDEYQASSFLDKSFKKTLFNMKSQTDKNSRFRGFTTAIYPPKKQQQKQNSSRLLNFKTFKLQLTQQQEGQTNQSLQVLELDQNQNNENEKKLQEAQVHIEQERNQIQRSQRFQAYFQIPLLLARLIFPRKQMQVNHLLSSIQLYIESRTLNCNTIFKYLISLTKMRSIHTQQLNSRYQAVAPIRFNCIQLTCFSLSLNIMQLQQSQLFTSNLD